ncbi:MAG TPA: hypothetical protein ENO01_02205 [Candidatus Marinimicrobia bacterium]|nr:hypothetical protein [Candidatus Neomarinimicrobiota bacterium]
MVTRSDYASDEVDICLSVMVELLTVIGELRDHVVLVGGWVPYFLIEEKQKEHTGSIDIDLAFDFNHISKASYKTILSLLEERGYHQGEQPFIFHRTVKTEEGREYTVQVDFIAGEYGGTGRSRRTQSVQDVRARKARGCDLVFENNFPVIIQKRMPDGAMNEVSIKVADVVPFLVMKGMALDDRYKEKDAYDIYFTVFNYPGGITGLAEEFEQLRKNKLVVEGLKKIKLKFKEIDSPGPVWVVNFLEIDDQEERERIQRDAFERMNRFLDSI